MANNTAAMFIPSFALALGVWSNSHKLFEVLYVTLWYLGPMNKVAALDFLGANSNGNIGFFIPFSIALIIVAWIGRARQLQNYCQRLSRAQRQRTKDIKESKSPKLNVLGFPAPCWSRKTSNRWDAQTRSTRG